MKAAKLLDAGGDAGGLDVGDGAVDEGEGGEECAAEGGGGVAFDGGIEDCFGLVDEDVANGVELACCWEGGGCEVGSRRIQWSDSGECIVSCAGYGGDADQRVLHGDSDGDGKLAGGDGIAHSCQLCWIENVNHEHAKGVRASIDREE